MKRIRTLVVDDEYLAIQVLENFLSQIPDIEWVGHFTASMKALDFLNREPVDLLFLDIQMPMLSGVNLVRSLRRPPLTIFTTAYSEFAVEAFDLNVVDYLLKPFAQERLLRAVGKAREVLNLTGTSELTTSASIVTQAVSVLQTEHLTVKSDGKLLRIALEDVWFVEGFGEYVWVTGPAGRILVLQTLRHFEETLPPDRFMRVHKSFIVGISPVRGLDGNELLIGSYKIPISRDKRTDVIQRFFGKL